MRVLITGGSGYIGSRIVQRLARRPDVEEIINVDIAAALPPQPDKVRLVRRSVTEPLTDLFTAAQVDLALHLAWVFDPLRDAERQRAICIGGTQRFLDGCAQGSVPHVLFMSSGTAYGAHPAHAAPVDEETPLKQHHHFQYSAEKRDAEELCRRLAADRPGTLLQIVRPCIVGGPHADNYIFRSVDKAVTFRPLGRPCWLQLVHEDDCADATVAILDRKLAGAFNLAGDGVLSLDDVYRRLGVRAVPLPLPLLKAIAGTAWARGWTELTEAPPEFLDFIAYPWLLSNRRVKEEVGYSFRYTAAETLTAYLDSR